MGYTDEKFQEPVQKDPYTFMLNPDSVKWTRSIEYNEQQAPGTGSPSRKFESVPGDELRFEVVMDCTGIVNGYESVAQAEPGQNLCVLLDSNTPVTRGEIITPAADIPFYTKWFQADICWLDAELNLNWGKTYIMRINGFTCNCCITLNGAPRPPLTINEF